MDHDKPPPDANAAPDLTPPYVIRPDGSILMDLGGFAQLSEPEPGPEGYHADFTRPFGISETARLWVVRVSSGLTMDTYGPFDTHEEAARWVIALDPPEIWVVEPLRRPEDWPGAPLDAPPEPDLPLLEGLDP